MIIKFEPNLENILDVNLKVFKKRYAAGVKLKALPTKFIGGMITTVTASTNSGKSTFIRALARELAEQGKNVLIWSTEETLEDFAFAYQNCDIERIKKHICVEVCNSISPTTMKATYERVGVDFVLFDYANTTSLSDKNDKSINVAVNNFMEMILVFNKTTNIHTFVVFQTNAQGYASKTDRPEELLSKFPNTITQITEGGKKGIDKAYNSYFIYTTKERLVNGKEVFVWKYILCKTRLPRKDLVIGKDTQITLGQSVEYRIDIDNFKFTYINGEKQ